MTINLNKLTNFQDAKAKFAELVKNNAGSEEQASAYSEMMDSLGTDMTDYIKDEVKAQTETVLNARNSDPSITQDEVKFFNELASGDLSHGTKEEVTLPETVITKIFEDIATEHPFLDLIGLQNTGLRLKFLKSDAEGAAVWGKVFGSIQGQLTATFDDEDATQSKLTAFVAIPNDVAEYGVTWIKTFVMTQIQEAFAVAAESAFIAGDGNNKPIGLSRQVQKDVVVTGGVYPEKASSGSITLADVATAKKELGAIVKALSKKENGKPFAARGKVVLVVEPGASIDLEVAMTMQNVNGQWVLAFPFGLQVVESEYAPTGKAIAFVPQRYDAYCAGPVAIKTFDQTLALQDGLLYTAKRFFYGKAEDDNVAKVYDLAITTSTGTTSTDSGSGK
ncbi:phage major capsid protein [Liquorilactobacillus hordei]|uniref:phage major capsid protein n=1 Tax=Liquorilactobacillus hordei TaxID=468911 RepID=UPI001CBC8438|nr:phage major capsid protein [Liquorilactobacillus hordei]MBZ2405124.1 phage major capsid protein [Liquorilactobacillus hordei]